MNDSLGGRTNGRSLLVDALLGAVVSIVLSVLPFSPVLGGAVAGYLHRAEGAKVGALSGAFAAIPLGGIFFLLVGVFAFVPVVGGAPRAALALPVLLLIIFAVALVYTVVLSTVGGVIGEYVRREDIL